jgi:methionyl-tRNA formyltransferase
LNGDEITGVSIISISKGKFDAGPLVWRQEEEIKQEDTFLTLSERLARIGGSGLFEVLSDYEGAIAKGVPQDSLGESSLAPLFPEKFNLLSFNKQTSLEASRSFKAFHGSNSRPTVTIEKIGIDTSSKFEGMSVYFDSLIDVNQDPELNQKANEILDSFGNKE